MVSCGVGPRCSLDPVLLWLWCRPVAADPIQPLDWELPYAIGAALKKPKIRGSHSGSVEMNPTGNHEVGRFDPWPRSVG